VFFISRASASLEIDQRGFALSRFLFILLFLCEDWLSAHECLRLPLYRMRRHLIADAGGQEQFVLEFQFVIDKQTLRTFQARPSKTGTSTAQLETDKHSAFPCQPQFEPGSQSFPYQ
jgi:hypothetical protein